MPQQRSVGAQVLGPRRRRDVERRRPGGSTRGPIVPRSSSKTAARSTCVGGGLDATGLRLGQVEQLVDQPEQVLGAGVDELDLLPLVRGERLGAGVEQQPGQPEHGVAGVRSSWLMLLRKRVLDSLASRSCAALVVDLGVQRDHALVGGLQLAGQLVVERHHAAVGLLQLGVDGRSSSRCGPHLAERGHQLAVLRCELVEGAAGDQAGQSPRRARAVARRRAARAGRGRVPSVTTVPPSGPVATATWSISRRAASRPRPEPLVDLGVAGARRSRPHGAAAGSVELEGDGATAGGRAA